MNKTHINDSSLTTIQIHPPHTNPLSTLTPTTLNAVKHGLNSRSLVIPGLGETDASWDQHLQAVVDDLEPKGYVEQEVVFQIAEILWRMRRVRQFNHQSAVLADLTLQEVELDIGWKVQRRTMESDEVAKLAAIPRLPMMVKGQSAEAHLCRMLRSAMKQLRELQVRRQPRVEVEVQTTEESQNKTSRVTVRNRLD